MLSITRKDVIECFEGKTSQEDVLVALYRVVFPDWDQISKIDGWPKVSHRTDIFIGQKFIAFDKKFHPSVMCGGLWLNNSFSTLDNENVPDWKADVSQCKIEYCGGA